MKTIVIYTSQTGFTRRYAQWIAQAAKADCLKLAAAKKKDLSVYEAIVFGGWACAGSIHKIRWFKENMEKWAGKRLIVFCVGASPLESPEVKPALEGNFNERQRERVGLFYCPGGLCYEKMPLLSKAMMRMFIKMLQAKKDKTVQEQESLRALSSSYDLSDKKYIEPILRCLKG